MYVQRGAKINNDVKFTQKNICLRTPLHTLRSWDGIYIVPSFLWMKFQITFGDLTSLFYQNIFKALDRSWYFTSGNKEDLGNMLLQNIKKRVIFLL